MASKVLDMPLTPFAAALHPPYGQAEPPSKLGIQNVDNTAYFDSYRDKHLSKFQMFCYDWGLVSTLYAPKPDGRALKMLQKYLQFPKPTYTMLDSERMGEIDNFYKVAQLQRAKLQDETGSVHPISYFKKHVYKYQCPGRLTSAYIEYPLSYTKYRDPLVLPITMERTHRSPMLPSRALTGKYARTSDTTYKQ